MVLFEKADPDVQAQKAAEAALRAKRRDRDGLAERLGIAEAAITSYRAQARQLAADGADDKAISAAEGKMRDAQDRRVTLSGAIGDVDKIIAGLSAEIERIVGKRCRAETNLAVIAMADELAEAQADFTKAAQRLEAAARERLAYSGRPGRGRVHVERARAASARRRDGRGRPAQPCARLSIRARAGIAAATGGAACAVEGRPGRADANGLHQAECEIPRSGRQNRNHRRKPKA